MNLVKVFPGDTMYLFDWTIAYIDSMNYFKKNLIKKSIINNEILCEYKEKGNVHYFIIEILDASVLDINKNNLIIVCLNKKENVLFLIDNWQELIKKKDLKIIFANPKENLYWALIPYVHNFVSGNLKLGLNALFESIPCVED